MAVIYPDNVKVARMLAVKNALGENGRLEVGTTGFTEIISEVPLGTGGVISVTGVWDIITTPSSDPSAKTTARASEARLRSALNEDVIVGLTVGLESAAAPNWTPNTAYSLGDLVTNGPYQYVCIVAGTSAGSGGPSVQSGDVTDGTAKWEHCAVAGADIQVSKVDVTIGEAFELKQARIIHA